MLQKLVKFINSSTFIINISLLVLLIIWSILGVWDFIGTDNPLYWKILLTCAALLIFNLLLVVVVLGIYRDNLKIIDIFNESQYATQHLANEIIFNTGDIGHEMYLVIKGKVEISLDNNVLETIETGGFFGEMAIIEDLPRSANARCINNCKLVKINEKRFYELIQEVPFFAQEVMKLMAHRLRKYDQH